MKTNFYEESVSVKFCIHNDPNIIVSLYPYLPAIEIAFLNAIYPMYYDNFRISQINTNLFIKYGKYI